MADPIARVLSGLTLIGVLALTWTVYSLDSSVTALHSDLTELAEVEAQPAIVLPPSRPRGTKGRKAKRGQPRATPLAAPVEPSEAVGEGGRKQRRRDRIKAKASRMKEEFEAFSVEHGIDDETGKLVLEELQIAKESAQLVRQDIHDGKISAKDGRAEIQAVRADTDAALVDLIGEASSTALKERLADWLDQKDDE